MIPAPSRSVEASGVLGRVPRVVVEPESVEAASAAMRALANEGAAVTFVGGGTDLGLGAPPARLDAVLSTRRLGRVALHAPSDQIVVAEAGLTIAALQAHLAPYGQRLALDPPQPEHATVGGVVAANAFGPRRLRYGAVRDLILGITIVRADGVVARGGGKVVKNVAGFDLPRVFCGSLGTLGLVAEVTFRLHPIPQRSATVLLRGVAAAEASAATRAVLDARLEPVAAVALPDGGAFTLAVRFEATGPGVADALARACAGAGPLAGGEAVEGDEEAALWARHDLLRTGGDVRAKATFPPAAIDAAMAALRPVRDALRGGAVVLHPALGIAFLSGALDDAAALAAAIEAARRALLPGNGAFVLAAAPPDLRTRVDPWGAAPSAIAVMRRLKAELDPDGRLAPGRFVGGI